MSTIEERLDRVRALICDADFLNGKGLSNEVNIRIFCYDPADEMAVRHFIELIKADQSIPCRLIERNLYSIFLDICEDLGIMESIAEMQEQDGSAFLLEQLQAAVGTAEFVEHINYGSHQPGSDVLLLSGVGEVFPFMRVHALLEALQPYFSDIPILVLYPGTYNGRSVKLFDRLQPHDYYRAFNVI